MNRFPASLVLLTAALPAMAAEITVTKPWARATLPGQDGTALYMTIASARDDALTGVDVADAGAAMLHRSVATGTRSQMEDVDRVPLPAGTVVSLRPGELHVMVMALAHPAQVGDVLHATLHFARGRDLTVDIPVLPVAARGP